MVLREYAGQSGPCLWSLSVYDSFASPDSNLQRILSHIPYLLSHYMPWKYQLFLIVVCFTADGCSALLCIHRRCFIYSVAHFSHLKKLEISFKCSSEVDADLSLPETGLEAASPECWAHIFHKLHSFLLSTMATRGLLRRQTVRETAADLMSV